MRSPRSSASPLRPSSPSRPDELDPCDLRLQRGDDAVRKLITGRKPMFEFMIRRQLAGHNLETVEGRVAALRAAAPVVAGIRDSAMVDGYVRNLAGWLGMEPKEVARAVTSARNASGRSAPAHTERERPGRPGEEPEQPARREVSLTELPTDPMTRLERDALMAILQYPSSVGPELVARATQVRFGNATLAVVRDAIGASLDVRRQPGMARSASAPRCRWTSPRWSPSSASPRSRSAANSSPSTAKGCVASLVDRDILRRKAEVLGAMQRATADGDQERWATLNRESAALESERRALRKE